MYEFECSGCGERFEQLVAAGTTSGTCHACGAAADRVLSPAAGPFRLVKSRGGARKQERRNAALRKQAKETFKARRRRAREQAGPGGSAGG